MDVQLSRKIKEKALATSLAVRVKRERGCWKQVRVEDDDKGSSENN